MFKKLRKRDKRSEKLIDEAAFDPSASASHGLDAALGDIAHKERVSGKTVTPKEEIEQYVSVSDQYGRKVKEEVKDDIEEGRSAAQVREERQLANAAQRGLRVLMITRDHALFEDGSEAQDRYATYGAFFDELHVIALTEKDDGQTGIVKFGEKMWVYPTNSRSALFAPYDAYRLAQEQLSFASGFRPDIIVSHAPFEEALAGHFLARKFDRAHLIEVTEDHYDPYFLAENDANKWRKWVAHFMLPRADCVRTVNDQLRTKVIRHYGELRERTLALPYFQDLAFWRDTEPTFNLKERYEQFSFIILVAASLRREQHIDKFIAAAAPLLSRYASVGMVIVGDGALKGKLKDLVLERALAGSVVLETKQELTVSHAKTADVFLNMGGEPENDRALSNVAAAGLPIISVASEHASALIEDEKSGFLCDLEDAACFQSRLNEFLNKNDIRTVFSKNVQERVFERFSKSKDAYYRSFAQMCEECVLSRMRARDE